MADGIFTKIRTIILAGSHELLDRVIDEMSPAVLKQFLRELEAAIKDNQSDAAIAEGDFNNTARKIPALEARIADLNSSIDLILGDGDPSNDGQAGPLEERLMAVEEEKTAVETEATSYKETMDALDEVTRQLQDRFNKMKGQLNKLESMGRNADAQNRAARAIEKASSHLGDAPSTDNLMANAERDQSIAGARLKRALGGITPAQIDPVVASEITARIAARRARLQG